MSAKEARLYQKLANRLVECEERSKLLRRMIKEEIGFNEEEQFIAHERGKLKGKNVMKKERREFLALIMGKKLKDNIYFGNDLRSEGTNQGGNWKTLWDLILRPAKGL